MARRSIQCSCGADFFIPEVAPSRLHCPKCGEPVSVGRGDAGPVTVREDIREPVKPLPPSNPWYPLYILGGAGVLLAGALVVLIIHFTGPDRKPPPSFEDRFEVRPKREPEPVISIREIPSTPKGLPEPSKPAYTPEPAPDVATPLAKAQEIAVHANAVGLVSTLLSLSGRRDEGRDLAAELARDHDAILKTIAPIAERPEVLTLKDYFQTDDVLLSFGAQSLDAARPQPFIELLREWIRSAQPGAMAMTTVLRGKKVQPLSMWFPEFPAALRRRVLPDAPAVSTKSVPLSAPLLAEVQLRTDTLHPFYRQAFPALEMQRMQELLRARSGSSDDEEFLRNRVLAYCARCEAERLSFEARTAALESAMATSVTLDTVFYRDGRKVQGQIEEQDETSIRIKGRFGAVTSPMTEVLKIERGDESGAEFRRRYDAARGNPVALTILLTWCRERKLAAAMELTATALLAADPGHDAAWTALGVPDRGAALSGPELDVLWLTDGTRREGIITDETETAFQIDVIVRGAKSETIGTGKATIPRSIVARVERMNNAARQRAQARTASFSDRARRVQEAQGGVALVSETFHGFTGLKATGTFFELHSTCAPAVVRESAFTLEEMFSAFRRHFSVRRNAGRRIDVFLLSNAQEYVEFQRAARGTVTTNPAFFDIRANNIFAFYGVQKEEEARIRSVIVTATKDIELAKSQLAAVEDKVTKEYRALRQQVLDAAAEERKRVGDNPKAQASIDRAKQEAFATLRAREREAMDFLSKQRTRANQAVAELEGVIRQNQAALAGQAREMYEILFHETFHAFATNFLWEEADNVGLPRWLHEGMACYFERSVVEGGELMHGGSHPLFLSILRGRQADSALFPIGNIVNAGPEQFQIHHPGDVRRQELAYAHAWGLAHYLMTRGVTRERLEAYVADVSAGRDRLAAFEKLAGKRLAEVEIDWRVHLESLR